MRSFCFLEESALYLSFIRRCEIVKSPLILFTAKVTDGEQELTAGKTKFPRVHSEISMRAHVLEIFTTVLHDQHKSE